jgi:Domain of unknown function (DUF4166)/Saccharopine dehydrogenase NADP binding domain
MGNTVTEQPLRVLIVGGTGVFGGRLVTGLLLHTEFAVVIAGRDAGRLAAMVQRCDALPGATGRITALPMDTRDVTANRLKATGAFAIVDAAGPFQGGDYRLATATIAAGIHYLDLADARDFIAGFGTLDNAAKQAGVVALTGVSTTPTLSNAVLDTLTAGWRTVDRIEIAVSPGNRAPRGLSVVRAILSYTGRPVRVFTDGRWCMRHGWGMTVRRQMPGLGRRWLSLAETPDLDIVPTRFAVRSAVFRAGLEIPLLHLGLLAASLPVRLGLIRSLTPLARPFRWIAGLLERFGTDRGGMTVETSGIDQTGDPITATWSLIAEAGDGPFVPTLPALAVLRALADGRIAQPGASACVGILPLADIEAEFAPHRIHSTTSFEPTTASLYATVLGHQFDQLPQPIREIHNPGTRLIARGIAQVDGADHLLGRLLAATFRFPSAADHVPVSVEITPSSGRERWVRDFGGRRFASTLSAAAKPGCLIERFGPLRFVLDLPTGPAGVLGMPVRGWRLGPLPLPRCLAPVSIATEDVDDNGRFRFDVELRLPLGLGRVVRYRGWLVDQASSQTPARKSDPPTANATPSPSPHPVPPA